MSKQNAVSTAIAAAVTALSLPMMPVMAEPLPAEHHAPVAAEAPVVPATAAPAAEASAPEAAPVSAETVPAAEGTVAPVAGSSLVAPASGSALAAPASPSVIAAPASPSIIAAPAATASATPVAGPAFSLPNIKLPFALSLSYRPETATMGGTGFAAGVPVAAGVPAAPAQFNLASQTGQGWSGTAEIGIPFISLGARTTSYGAPGMFDPSVSAADANNKPAAGSLPYYWPEGAWSTYVRAFGLRFGYLNEQFNRGLGQDGAIGSLVGGLDSGFSLFGLIGVDYHALAGWGIHGQTVQGTTTSHLPAEAEASVYANLGPVNLRAGYVARATFTGDPSTFLTILTSPMSLASDEQKRDTVNQTRLGTYMGPFFGAGFTF